jgi:hypothetical protein
MTLPKVAASVVAEVLEQLPSRLHKRVDAAVAKASSWTVSADGVVVDAETTLRFELHDEVLTSAADLTCSCLLAPRCLHRAVFVSVAPVSADAQVDSQVAPESAGTALGSSAVAAVELLWVAGGLVLRAGVSGSGSVLQASMLRAVHAARLAGLHRAAAAALRVVTGIRAAHSGSSAFARATLADDLAELLLVCHQLRAGIGDVSALRGTARREYQPIGSLRLHGLFTERVVTDSGYAGVVSHLVDSKGGLWTIPALSPGDADEVAAAYDGPVALGESGLSHRQLSRAGLLLSSATASADRRLGAGANVRAVAAAGAPWSASPLWDEPLADQVRRAFRTDNQLLFLDDVAARQINLIGSSDLAWENLRLMSGMELSFIARLVPSRPLTAVALAASGPLHIPESWGGVVNLTLERLQRSNVDEPRQLPGPPDPGPSPIALLERRVQRIVMGGRKIHALNDAAADQARLTRLGLTTTAQVLANLHAASRDTERDHFGRLLPEESDDFVLAWLRAHVHTRTFTESTAHTSWNRAVPPE